jgi:microcystin-dependent protein
VLSLASFCCCFENESTGEGALVYTLAELQAVLGGGGGVQLPVGFVFISTVATNPATLLGYGTWNAAGAGRVLVGIGAAPFDVPGATLGEVNHTLTTPEIPAHTHVQNAHGHAVTDPTHNHTQNAFAPRILNSGTAGTVGVQGASAASNAAASNAATTATNQAAATGVSVNNQTAVNQNAGGDGAHNNVQPSLVVYMFERVA